MRTKRLDSAVFSLECEVFGLNLRLYKFGFTQSKISNSWVKIPAVVVLPLIWQKVHNLATHRLGRLAPARLSLLPQLGGIWD
jgi:hypothetical protein